MKTDVLVVGADEERGFEEVVRYWTLWVLSGMEGD